MKRVLLTLSFFGVVTLPATPAWAATYAIVVGHNGVPTTAEEVLEPLRYADDDAARWADFFDRFADVELLTVLDKETQVAHPGLAAQSRVPTADNLNRAVDRVRKAVERDADAGEDATVFFVYSGHGAHTESGVPFLTLHGQDVLGREELYASVASIPARVTHMVIDACHAAAIVGTRGGFFGEEREAEHVDTGEVLERLAAPPDLSAHPHVGVLLSAAAGESSHEWSEVSSGVFTHEVLSALHGAADVNSDGKIEYSEVAAYVGAANREVPDPRAVPTVVAKPPAADARAAIVDVGSMGRVVRGAADAFGRFSIETTTGVRIVEGHLAGTHEVAVRVPDTEAHLRLARGQAILPGGDEDIALADLTLGEPPRKSRGAVDAAFRRGLFAAPYGPDYYRGFVDSKQMISAPLSAERPPAAPSEEKKVAAPTESQPVETTVVETKQAPPVASPRRKPTASIILFSTSALFVAGGVASTVAAANARADFEATEFQREAAEAADRFQGHRSRSFLFYSLGAATAIGGFLAFPWNRGPTVSAGFDVVSESAFVHVRANW